MAKLLLFAVSKFDAKSVALNFKNGPVILIFSKVCEFVPEEKKKNTELDTILKD